MGLSKIGCKSAVTLFCLVILSACQPQLSTTDGANPRAITTCSLPAEQGTKSMIGMWEPLYKHEQDSSLKIFLDPKFAATNQDIIVKRAIDTWNSFSNASFKLGLMNYTDQPSVDMFYSYKYGNTDSDVRLSSYSAERPKKEIYIYYIDDKAQWTSALGFDSDAMGVTLNWWPSDGGQSKNANAPRVLVKATLYLNFYRFFKLNPKYPDEFAQADLQSVVLHELGHVVGLDHSCGPINADKSATQIDCPTSPLHSFNQAVMFWKLGSNETKQDLRQNDQGRLNCLYGL